MALHLNLYHEVQKQKTLQRRDPLKFAIAGLAAVAACFAGYYLLQLNSQRLISNELKSLERELSTLTPKAEEAKKRAAEVTAIKASSDTLVARIEKRFYWAPILADIAQIVPHQVQLTKFAGEVSDDQTKRCSFTIDGIAAGDDPRKVAEDLRRTLVEHLSGKYKAVTSEYRTLEESPDTATLNGQKVPTVTFGISIVMQAGEDPAPDPATPARTAKK